VISPFGENADEEKHFKQVLKHLIKHVLEPKDYVVKRFDEIDESGLITNQVIERLLDDDLVVADLTNRNPNVYYELAVRHAARKPVIHIIQADQELPFDLKNLRIVKYSLADPDALEDARSDVVRKVEAIEADAESPMNPVVAAREVSLLKASDRPDQKAIGDVLAEVASLRDELRGYIQAAFSAMIETTAPPGTYMGGAIDPASVIKPLRVWDVATPRFRYPSRDVEFPASSGPPSGHPKEDEAAAEQGDDDGGAEGSDGDDADSRDQ
jgi:hypothetical protein